MAELSEDGNKASLAQVDAEVPLEKPSDLTEDKPNTEEVVEKDDSLLCGSDDNLRLDTVIKIKSEVSMPEEEKKEEDDALSIKEGETTESAPEEVNANDKPDRDVKPKEEKQKDAEEKEDPPDAEAHDTPATAEEPSVEEGKAIEKKEELAIKTSNLEATPGETLSPANAVITDLFAEAAGEEETDKAPATEEKTAQVSEEEVEREDTTPVANDAEEEHPQEAPKEGDPPPLTEETAQEPPASSTSDTIEEPHTDKYATGGVEQPTLTEDSDNPVGDALVTTRSSVSRQSLSGGTDPPTRYQSNIATSTSLTEASKSEKSTKSVQFAEETFVSSKTDDDAKEPSATTGGLFSCGENLCGSMFSTDDTIREVRSKEGYENSLVDVHDGAPEDLALSEHPPETKPEAEARRNEPDQEVEKKQDTAEAAKLNKSVDNNSKPQEEEVAAEKPQEQESLAVKPQEEAVPAEKLQEEAVPAEKLQEEAVPAEKPQEEEDPADKTKESTAVDKPQETEGVVPEQAEASSLVAEKTSDGAHIDEKKEDAVPAAEAQKDPVPDQEEEKATVTGTEEGREDENIVKKGSDPPGTLAQEDKKELVEEKTNGALAADSGGDFGALAADSGGDLADPALSFDVQRGLSCTAVFSCGFMAVPQPEKAEPKKEAIEEGQPKKGIEADPQDILMSLTQDLIVEAREETERDIEARRSKNNVSGKQTAGEKPFDEEKILAEAVERQKAENKEDRPEKPEAQDEVSPIVASVDNNSQTQPVEQTVVEQGQMKPQQEDPDAKPDNSSQTQPVDQTVEQGQKEEQPDQDLQVDAKSPDEEPDSSAPKEAMSTPENKAEDPKALPKDAALPIPDPCKAGSDAPKEAAPTAENKTQDPSPLPKDAAVAVPNPNKADTGDPKQGVSTPENKTQDPSPLPQEFDAALPMPAPNKGAIVGDLDAAGKAQQEAYGACGTSCGACAIL